VPTLRSDLHTTLRQDQSKTRGQIEPCITEKLGQKNEENLNFENLLTLWGGKKSSRIEPNISKSEFQNKRAGKIVTNHSKSNKKEETEYSSDELKSNSDWSRNERMGNDSK
jgi:hypothetical protein